MHKDIQQQPARRIGALVLIRDGEGRVLLEETTYREGAQLPGGAVHQGEQVADGAARELAEETGLSRVIAFHLGVDQIPANPNTGAVEGFNFICDGGFVTDAEKARLSIPVGASEEIKALVWVSLDELDDHTAPYMAARIRIAVDHAEAGLRQPLLYIGQPAGARHVA
ncbi:NUDIX domain-containing protein [Streptomyces sp. NRRL S-350]|uniref:NUDIX domain-containing protein n=1 Tax=Streptomyces sp. NRRL S-350 TaxID=1463902 RepID=UPI00068E0995|nr:NUDIX hydrolase [Streptomyces sp. NRRL S-350]